MNSKTIIRETLRATIRLKNPNMRAQIKNPSQAALYVPAISLTSMVKYVSEAESFSGFSGGNTYYFYCNSTLQRSLVTYSEKTYSSPTH